MHDHVPDEPGRALRERVREFIRSQVGPEYQQRMDRHEIRFPREPYQQYARHGLLCFRQSTEEGR